MPISAIDRFWEKVIINPSSCWEWQGCLVEGYGQFWDGQSLVYAHRFLYKQMIGEVPIGLQLDHLCRNRKCVNPDHLEVVTPKTNINRGICSNRIKTHCPQGHPYTEVNTYHHPQGWRICKICQKNSHINDKRKNHNKIKL